MFGYFKMDKKCPSSLADEYKKYYCVLCRSLERHYGFIARLFLSYDVTLFMVLQRDNPELENMLRVPCIGNTNVLKCICEQNVSKKCAALNLLLAAEKLEDDVLDENTLSSRLLLAIFSGLFSKARRDFPDVWEMIHTKYTQLRQVEKENSSLEDAENVFSDMMIGLARDCFDLQDPDRLRLLEFASKWLYFIDAVDDLDSNIKANTFNPFCKCGSFYELKNSHYQELAEHYQSLCLDLRAVNGTEGSAIVNRIIFYGIPEETIRVLTKQRKMF